MTKGGIDETDSSTLIFVKDAKPVGLIKIFAHAKKTTETTP